MIKLTRIAALGGLLLAVALPGTALARGGPGDDDAGASDDTPAQSRDTRGDRAAANRQDDGKVRTDRRAARAERRAERLRRTEFRGVVKAVDATAKTVTVTVVRAERGGRGLRDRDVVFAVADTRLDVADRNADGARDVADVAAGDRVRVVALVTRSQLAAGVTTAPATRVKARAPKAAQPAS
jgi:hypothetical protein